jgi:hypothetical protein
LWRHSLAFRVASSELRVQRSEFRDQSCESTWNPKLVWAEPVGIPDSFGQDLLESQTCLGVSGIVHQNVEFRVASSEIGVRSRDYGVGFMEYGVGFMSMG